MHPLLRQHFARFADHTDAEMASIERAFRLVTLSAREWLLREGEVCHFEAFVTKGCLRKYCIDEAGHEINLQFAVADWWISDLESFTEVRPSSLFIQALEQSEMFLIARDQKEQLFQQIPSLERMFRLLVQRHHCTLQNRFVNILTRSAEARYLDFMDRYPQLLTQIPQHHIASYLGVTPEFLSKVRRRLSEKRSADPKT